MINLLAQRARGKKRLFGPEGPSGVNKWHLHLSVHPTLLDRQNCVLLQQTGRSHQFVCDYKANQNKIVTGQNKSTPVDQNKKWLLQKKANKLFDRLSK